LLGKPGSPLYETWIRLTEINFEASGNVGAVDPLRERCQALWRVRFIKETEHRSQGNFWIRD